MQYILIKIFQQSNGLELYPNGKCYLIKSDNTLRKNIVVRELTQEEYAKLDIQKGRDF